MKGKKLGANEERAGAQALRANRRGALKPLVCSLMLIAPVAQAEAQAESERAKTLAPITVSANPLGLDLNSTTLPASVLEGDALIEQRAGTLGDTLKNLPGVNSDTFGGGASRPVIRGQTAPRVKVLSDGSEVMDASSISPDHAVTVEPMLAERIEVLRGPATLLYGGGAIGGVVNVVDKKIPTYVPEKGIEAEAELRGATGTKERAGAGHHRGRRPVRRARGRHEAPHQRLRRARLAGWKVGGFVQRVVARVGRHVVDHAARLRGPGVHAPGKQIRSARPQP